MVQDIDKKDVPLSKFKGKVLLIVNVASRWYVLLFTLYLCLAILSFSTVMFGGELHPLPSRVEWY